MNAWNWQDLCQPTSSEEWLLKYHIEYCTSDDSKSDAFLKYATENVR